MIKYKFGWIDEKTGNGEHINEGKISWEMFEYSDGFVFEKHPEHKPGEGISLDNIAWYMNKERPFEEE